MGIQEAVTSCFSKYVTFQGRAQRSEFWWFGLFCLIVIVVLMAISAATEGSIIVMILLGLFYLAIILPSIAVCVRRLHDTDHSGWWFFIQMVPVVGPFWYLYFLVIAGTPGPNRFGN